MISHHAVDFRQPSIHEALIKVRLRNFVNIYYMSCNKKVSKRGTWKSSRGENTIFQLLKWNSKTWLELGSNGYFLVLIDISNFIFHFHFLSGLTKSGTQKTRNKKLDFLRNYRKWKWKMKLEISISTKKYPFEPSLNHILILQKN